MQSSYIISTAGGTATNTSPLRKLKINKMYHIFTTKIYRICKPT